jgi:DNA invertase Pin-like site-specific DNA recombinase
LEAVRRAIHGLNLALPLIGFHVFGSVAELERDLILKRMKASLEVARARGRKDGRKSAIDDRKTSLSSKLIREGKTPISGDCEVVGVSSVTLYRNVRLYGTPGGKEEDSG